MTKAGCVAVALSILAFVAQAQNASADDMVNVNISDHEMINGLAGVLNVDVGQIPLIVQVPLRLAARVCDMRASDLAADSSGEPANCDAMTVSPAFRQAVKRQLLAE
jgi:hypothetical protein